MTTNKITIMRKLEAVEQSIREAYREIDKYVMTFVPVQIKKRTRLGYGVKAENEKQERLAGLSPNYVKRRKNLDLNSETRPGKSNLTRTGQMLDGIEAQRLGEGEYRFFINGNRNDSDLSNDEVATFVEKAGRPFFHLSKTERANIFRSARKIIQNALKRLRG